MRRLRPIPGRENRAGQASHRNCGKPAERIESSNRPTVFVGRLFIGHAIAYRPIRFNTIALISVISSIAKRTPSRPRPEFFTPP